MARKRKLDLLTSQALASVPKKKNKISQEPKPVVQCKDALQRDKSRKAVQTYEDTRRVYRSGDGWMTIEQLRNHVD